MNIAVYHNLPAGGAKRVLFEEVRRLSLKHNIDLYEMDSEDKDFLDIRFFANNVYIFKINLFNNLPIFINRIYRDWKNFFSLRKIHYDIAKKINSKPYDVCLIHPDKFTQAPFLLRYINLPTVYYCHELLRIAYEKELRFNEKVVFYKTLYENLTRKYRKKIDKVNAQKASIILTNSEYVSKKVKRFYKREASVCYPGVDLKVFKKISKKKNKILFVGERHKIDGYDLIEKALSFVPKNIDFEFEVVSFSKKRTDRKLAKKYSESILTLCTSINEPFGLIAIESMACETPVLAVKEGGYKETVLHGKTGFLLKRDPKEFSEKITYLLENPKLAEDMGRNAREYVSKKFSWERHYRLLEEVMLGLCQKSKK